MSDNAYNFYAAVNAVRKDIAEGKHYSADDLNYIYAALSNVTDLINEMKLNKS